MTFHPSTTARLVVALGALALFSACSSSDSSGAGTSVAPTTTATPTTPAPTTVAPTTEASTTLAPVVEAPPFLRGNGLGPFDFGAPYADVLAGMPLTFARESSYTFPNPVLFFAHPAGREVCWQDGGAADACAYFGGADPASVALVGWYYASGPGAGQLSSNIGATTNILVSAVPAMPTIEGACYDYTTVSLDGVVMGLSTGSSEWFGTYADDGTFTLTTPTPAGARITYMQAGDIFSYSEGADC